MKLKLITMGNGHVRACRYVFSGDFMQLRTEHGEKNYSEWIFAIDPFYSDKVWIIICLEPESAATRGLFCAHARKRDGCLLYIPSIKYWHVFISGSIDGEDEFFMVI